MKRHFSFAFISLALVFSFSLSALGQETTGSIEITSRDPNGAVVPSVTVTVSSSTTGTTSTTGFRRTVTTDKDGFARVIEVPPGTYDITGAPTAGFAERSLSNVKVLLGKSTLVNLDLGITTTTTNVEVSGGDVLLVDTTDSKIQTNIPAELVELLPKGTNFASVLKISPGTRVEPRSGQFQIDGASGSENTFIIDGQEVTNVRTGVLDGNSNLPFQLVQEIQVKSSGFEAEYGGATGGVINVVTKGGSNQWHGEFGSQFRPSKLAAVARPVLTLNTVTNAAEYVSPERDSYVEYYPSANLGGPILKDRLWFFASYTPQIFKRNRTINFVAPSSAAGTSIDYKFTQVRDYAFLRLDAQPFSKLRLTGTYIYNPISQKGSIPSFVVADETPPVGADLAGGRQNSQSYTGQGTWTPTNNIVLAFRGGHYFLNEKLGSYGISDVTVPRRTCSGSSPIQFPAGFGCVRGFNNGLPVNTNTLYDATARNTFDADGTFLTSFGGRHVFKAGYQYNGVSNKLLTQTRDQIVLRYGQTIASYSQHNIPSSPTALGAGLLRQFRESGDVSSKSEALYFQDKWQPFKSLTLNLGVRVDREDVPSFTEGLPGIKFDFVDKIAPRLGVAYDLTGDGKTKVSAFYGWFYDRFKYELPRGSFGGNFFHDFFYEIQPGDTFASFTPASILGTGVGVPGGACPSNTTAPVFGRVRCDIDFRVPSNSGLGVEFGTVDPDIKAFRQSEFTVTFERDLGRNFVFAGRYSYKNVDHTIEDAGFPLPSGSEAYIIGNPGEGLYKQLAEEQGLMALKPKRRYDALEFRLDKRFSQGYYFNLNYTFSRLVGNYSGLASSDEDGRLSPNVNRFFDQPQSGWTVAGGPDNGVLPTDRPHVLKFNGAYSLDWGKRVGFLRNNSTEFQVFTSVQSGTPITSTVELYNVDFIVLNKRGDLGRTELFTETDFAIRHRWRFGSDERFTLVFEADVLNAFNEANVLDRENSAVVDGFDVSQATYGLVTPAQEAGCVAANNVSPCLLIAYRNFQLNGAPLIAADVSGNAANRNPLYNLPNTFQGPRSVRFGVRFVF
ncbi:MAG: TonB-dependent receptor [Pyrinomonadaceae bacterium]